MRGGAGPRGGQGREGGGTKRESTKDPKEVLGADSVAVLREHMKWMEGVWPPPGDEGAEEQRCGI